jgi:N-acylneuraminate cytidylyltransferase
VVAARCKKLNVECVQGCDEKRARLELLLQQRGLSPSEVAYVGNDVNDLACMECVGAAIAVADAEGAVRSVATLVTARAGGHGAVREVCDWILEARRRRVRASDSSAPALDTMKIDRA